ncbi:alkaline phosphatase family protein [Brevibacterium sp. 5221]|uniref:Alkaline phosphatase family protein n=1 Tax=Brevibacterium rongguiense TaxID=2695267 RepID=A0A6N9H8R0_9MICO|nr:MULTISPECIES: nucleotide pyrophosphatase/phosphodiesterase family protein [Brevibacterium]MYM20409.1 alkaline phosphatase family protein [Brevibacterium rongguiense]WAL40316.1 alkaline phosphatase family protein [Brevibacterium sp. BRM-1]
MLRPPDYAAATLLSDIVPLAATAIGAAEALDAPARARAAALAPGRELRVAVVALIDGMGAALLRRRAAHAPFLRFLLPAMRPASAGFPSTTANSLSSLGTGLLPGGHGVMGYRLLDPERGAVFNQLTWDSDTDPEVWVPDATLFERIAGTGADVVSLGEPKFAGRGLNRASLRGGRFRGSGTLSERVAHAAAEARAPGRRLVYFYWGGLDRAGHVYGTDSWEWLSELEAVDAALRELAERLPRDAGLFITADHGMVDVPHAGRLDVAEHPELRAGLADLGGEPRAVHLYARPGAAADVRDAFAAAVGDRGRVLTRAEAVAGGWFGPVRPANEERIGDVLVVADGDFGIVDSQRDSPSALALLGHHGGVSEDELAIPLLAALG